MDIQEKKIIINDLIINYYLSGEDNKEILIFLHGWRSSSNVWFPLINKLSDNYKIYAVDLPGFGKSSIPKIAFNAGDYGNVVKLFIEKLKLDKVTLIGHSHGGRTALKLASKQPGTLKSLVLVDSSGIRLKSFRVQNFIAKAVKPLFTFKFTDGLKRRIYKWIDSEDYNETPELHQTYLNLINEDLRIDLEKINIATLIIWGKQDKSTPLEIAMILNKGISNSKLEIIDEAGHYPYLDKPEQFLKILLEFLKKENV